MVATSPEEPEEEGRVGKNNPTEKVSSGHSASHHGKPLGWLKFVAEKPCRALGNGCLFFFFLFMLLNVLSMAGVEVLVMATEVPMYLWEHETKINLDAMMEAGAVANSRVGRRGSYEREQGEFSLEIIYQSANGESLLNEASLQYIKAFEEKIVAAPEYQDFCQLDHSKVGTSIGRPICVPHLSAINFFDPDYFKPAADHNSYTTEVSEQNTQLLQESLINRNATTEAEYYLFANPYDPTETSGNFHFSGATFTALEEFHLGYQPDFATNSNIRPIIYYSDNGETITSTNFFWAVSDSQSGWLSSSVQNTVVTALRSQFHFGVPRWNPNRADTLYATEGDDLEEQRLDLGIYLFDAYEDMLQADLPNIKLNWSHEFNGMLEAFIQANLNSDGALAFLSMMFVMFYIVFTTSSFWLGCFGMGMVLLNFIPAILLYRFVAGYTYFGTLNMLAVFIILGVGADDIFVFLDTWSQSNVHLAGESVHVRLSATLRHAGKAMATTSFSTVFSFLANATSSFPAVYTFGVFCAFLILCNFVSMVFFFPRVVASWDYYAKGAGNWSCVKCGYCKLKSKGQRGPTKTVAGEAELGSMEKWFRDVYYVKFIHPFNKVICLGFLGIVIFYVVIASQLEPDPEPPQFFPKDSNYVAYKKVVSQNFRREENPFRVVTQVVVGIDYLDRNCMPSDTKACGATPDPTIESDRGTIHWKDGIDDLLTVTGQKFLLDMCEDLRSGMGNGVTWEQRKVYAADSIIPNPVNCWIEALRDWCLRGQDVCTTFPMEAEYEGHMFEVSLAWFFAPMQANDVGYQPGFTYYDYWKDYTFGEDAGESVIWRFFYVEAQLSVMSNTPYSDGITLHETWREWGKGWAAEGAMLGLPVAETMFVTDEGGAFHYFYLQKVITDEAFFGIGLSLFLAFLILCAATYNWRMAVFSTITIGVLVMGVVAFTVLAGWKLGLVEAMIYVMVVGLSVDYVVHLSDAYLESGKELRGDRVQKMLEMMGVSIISGAFSTLGSSFFLLLAFIVFFTKFGTVIFFVIAQSLLFSLGGFAALLDWKGPEGNEGDLTIVRQAWKETNLSRIACLRSYKDWVRTKEGTATVTLPRLEEKVDKLAESVGLLMESNRALALENAELKMQKAKGGGVVEESSAELIQV